MDKRIASSGMFVDVIEQTAQSSRPISSWVQDDSRNKVLILLLRHRDVRNEYWIPNRETKQRNVMHKSGGGYGSIAGVVTILSGSSEIHGYSEILDYLELFDTGNWKQKSWILLWAGDWKLESWVILWTGTSKLETNYLNHMLVCSCSWLNNRIHDCKFDFRLCRSGAKRILFVWSGRYWSHHWGKRY